MSISSNICLKTVILQSCVKDVAKKKKHLREVTLYGFLYRSDRVLNHFLTWALSLQVLRCGINFIMADFCLQWNGVSVVVKDVNCCVFFFFHNRLALQWRSTTEIDLAHAQEFFQCILTWLFQPIWNTICLWKQLCIVLRVWLIVIISFVYIRTSADIFVSREEWLDDGGKRPDGTQWRHTLVIDQICPF